MERISSALSKPQPISAGVSLSNVPGKRVSAEDGLTLLHLMDQAQAVFHTQLLPELTVEVFLRGWEEMAVQFGLKIFAESLWKVISDVEFFPTLKALKQACREAYRDEHRNDWFVEKQAQEAAQAAHRLAHPEEYEHVRNIWAAAVAKREAKDAEAKSQKQTENAAQAV